MMIPFFLDNDSHEQIARPDENRPDNERVREAEHENGHDR